jgi:hypothetical protein
MSDSVEWARRQREQLLAEIRRTEERAQRRESGAEQLGLLRASDRLPALRRRLSEVEHLIEAVGEKEPLETGWPAFLGDPRAPPGARKPA